MADVEWDPAGYPDDIRQEIPRYEELQRQTVDATAGVHVETILELGTGTGETAARLLAVHPDSRLVGIDASEAMAAAARAALPAGRVDVRIGRLEDPLPATTFDLVVSALAVHHLSREAKTDLFGRVAAVLRPGGRFVLGDVVVPDDPRDAEVELTEGIDLPDPVADQLAWFRAAGLAAEVVWTWKDLAVLRGERAS